MASITPRERLTRLVNIASDPGTSSRGELTSELADLLLEWPKNYPAAMREPFEALLEKALSDIAPDARGLLAKRFVGGNMPLTVLNALFFDAAPEVKNEILSRNAASPSGSAPRAINEQALLAVARAAEPHQVTDAIAERFGIGRSSAAAALADASAYSLACLCKGASLSRAAYSALAVLAESGIARDERYRRLAAYDAIPEAGARALLRFWQRETDTQFAGAAAA
jgi:hypothetical protein